MEIVTADGSRTQLKPGQTRELGRSHGLDSSDKTISRRQISFFIPPFTHNHEFRVQFEVFGKNPVYVYKDNEVKVYRRFERGEMGKGDMFCVSAKNPVWYNLREVENGFESVRRNDLESELAENMESGFGFKGVEDLQQEGVDISDIDPVKEFGFVVIGHEFDSYSKKMILDIKNWDWFLEESRKDSEDDEDEGRRRNGSRRRKRKKGKESDDDEWTGESEDDKVVIKKSRKDQRAKYMTRSKDCGETSKDRRKNKSTGGKKNRVVVDEDDETLGGFIVDEENMEEEEEEEEEEDEDEEEEEEEFGEDDDEDE